MSAKPKDHTIDKFCKTCGELKSPEEFYLIKRTKVRQHLPPARDAHCKKRLAVDHCHVSGKIRGLLCFHCNSSLGKMKDSVEILQNAIDYLKKNRE